MPDKKSHDVLKMFINEQFKEHPDVLTKERILHCKGVADFMYCYAKIHKWEKFTWKRLYVLGILHDMGYLENHIGINHSDKGVEILKEMSINEHWLYLIKNHGKYIEVPTKELELLWLADMCIDRNGRFEGYEHRYASILSRYDENDPRLDDVHKIIQYLRKHFPEYSGMKKEENCNE